MKSFASPSKAAANRASSTVQQTSQPNKSIVNNRPSSVAQRKLQQHIDNKTNQALPFGNVTSIQRVAVSLQNEDKVIENLATYSQKNLGVQDEANVGFPTNKKELGKNEPVYLYGHGGHSRLDHEEHDAFAGRLMTTLAAEINNSFSFPENYQGTIYLIGCKTADLTGQLKDELKKLTGKGLDIKGTVELLEMKKEQVEGEEVVKFMLRDPPAEEGKHDRAYIDTLRSYFKNLMIIKDAFVEYNTSLQTIQGHQALIVTGEFLKNLDTNLSKSSFIKANKKLLEQADNKTLRGRYQGLIKVDEIYDKFIKTNKKAKEKFLLATEDNVEEDIKFNHIKKILVYYQFDLIDVGSLLDEIKKEINDYDKDHVTRKPFTLDQMK